MSYEDETYQPFVKIANEGSEEFMELPSEADGTVLLSTVHAQFPNAIGLKYKGSSGAWRGIRAAENVLAPPATGWGDDVYYITQAEVLKRKSDAISDGSSPVKSSKPSVNKLLEDLIVFGLPFTTTNEELEEYFTKACGELAYFEVKFDRNTSKSRGFGFIRFKTEEAAKEALNGEHEISGRKLDIRSSKQKVNPMKLFVGRLPSGTTKEGLTEYFSEFGELHDVYVPTPYKGFGFVTFCSQEEAKVCLRDTHVYKGAQLNVVIAEPREERRPRGPPQSYNNGPPQSYNSGPPQSYNSGPPRSYNSGPPQSYNNGQSKGGEYNRSSSYGRGSESSGGEKNMNADLKSMLFAFLTNQK